VIRPHLPVRPPCYDLTLLTGPRFDATNIRSRLTRNPFGWFDGQCVQGAGTYSLRDDDTFLSRVGSGPPRVPSDPLDPDGNMGYGSRSLPHLRGHLTARTGDGHAPPLSSSSKTFNLAFTLLSVPVRFPALTPIKPQASRLVVLPRQFL